MKVFYNSWLAKAILPKDFIAITLLGMVFTKEKSLPQNVLVHEEVHCKQYRDCVIAGSVIAFFIAVCCILSGHLSLHLLWLLLIPLLLYYVIYALEYIVRRWYMVEDDAYRNIGFEKQASWIESTFDKPENEKNLYCCFGWWNEMR